MSRRGLARGLPLVALATSCKRQRAPKVSETWDEHAGLEHTEALASLAPPWPTPVRARLDSGLVTMWLQEPGAVALHLRVLLPTHGPGHEVTPAHVVAAVAEHLRFELQRRTTREGAQVDVAHGPDRIELTVHGRDEDTDTLLERLGHVLAPAAPVAALERARDRVAEHLSGPSTEEIALAALTASLLQRAPEDHRIDAAALRALDRDALDGAWSQLTDPRRAVLVVHAARDADDARPQLRRLSDAWHGRGRADVEQDAVARLRADPRKASRTARRLLAEPAEPLVLAAGGRGPPHLVLGRVVATPTPADRSLARLAQRLLQEELDARLVVAGPRSIFVATTRLSSDAPDHSAAELVDALGASADARHPAQRMFAAAELWLGARVVQASLHGEDWTALFSESIDLADRDRDIASALARDAATMLEPDPEALRAWQKRWLHPRAGEPGWQWIAAGTDRRIEHRLERIVPVAPA